MRKIFLEKVRKDFVDGQDKLEVLKNISMTLYTGELVSIIGPSGCGKSTIFHLLTKIEERDGGIIEIEGKPIEEYDKGIGYMPQKDLLMPWRNLLDNVRIPLEIQGMDKQKSIHRIRDLLPIFGLEGFEHSYPHQLSGGMRQRAALLRTMLIDSDILLLDEPFAALDAINRAKMQDWLLEICNTFKPSVFFITHDVDEGIYLSDRIYVLSQRPAEVLEELKIDFPRPREKGMMLTTEFLEYKKCLIDLLG